MSGQSSFQIPRSQPSAGQFWTIAQVRPTAGPCLSSCLNPPVSLRQAACISCEVSVRVQGLARLGQRSWHKEDTLHLMAKCPQDSKRTLSQWPRLGYVAHVSTGL